MQRNTVHPLGNLRTGDRFYFAEDKKRTVYQTTDAKCKKPYVAYTQYPDKVQTHYVEKRATAFAQVVFLRHTRAVAGEEVMLEELHVGDVFYMLDDIITEYCVVHLPGMFTDTIIRDLAATEPPFETCDMGVIFIRKSEEVNA